MKRKLVDVPDGTSDCTATVSQSTKHESCPISSGKIQTNSISAPRILLNATTTQQTSTPKSTLLPFKAFKTRRPRPLRESQAIHNILAQDKAIQNYFEAIKARPGNRNQVPHDTRSGTLSAARLFLEYIGFEITDHAISDLVNLKRNNPNDMQIETALRPFSNLDTEGHHLHTQRNSGISMLGIFRQNFAPLSLRISNHFEPRTENCTEGIFRAIYNKLNEEQKAIIQWQLFAPERAEAIFNVPLSDIDLSRKDMAIIAIQSHRSKSKTKHYCLMPKQFAQQVVESAKAAGRGTPFPNYETLWRQIRQFAETEYQVLLHSHYIRKLFQSIAEQTEMPPNHYIVLMGSKPTEGHLPEIYSLAGQFTAFGETLISEYKTYLIPALTLSTSSDNSLPRDTNANEYDPSQESRETTQPRTSHNISSILEPITNLD